MVVKKRSTKAVPWTSSGLSMPQRLLDAELNTVVHCMIVLPQHTLNPRHLHLLHLSMQEKTHPNNIPAASQVYSAAIECFAVAKCAILDLLDWTGLD